MKDQTDFHRKCLHTALRLLTKRNHGIEELKKKLQQRKFPASAIESALDECIRLNYLNDEIFSEMVVNHYSKKGYGPQYIKQKLITIGIAEHLVTNALLNHYGADRQIKACRQALIKKISLSQRPADRLTIKNKLYRFLYARGFSQETINQAISAELDE